jgi:hypothetical protein
MQIFKSKPQSVSEVDFLIFVGPIPWPGGFSPSQSIRMQSITLKQFASSDPKFQAKTPDFRISGVWKQVGFIPPYYASFGWAGLDLSSRFWR